MSSAWTWPLGCTRFLNFCKISVSAIFSGRNEVVANVMFLLVSVILSKGGDLPQYTPREQELPPDQAPPRSRHPPGAGTPPAYGQWAAGTHPTRMHSCLWSLCSVVFHALTLKLPIQTSLSVAPELKVSFEFTWKMSKFQKYEYTPDWIVSNSLFSSIKIYVRFLTIH